MNKKPDPDGILFLPAQSRDSHAILRLYAEIFSLHEPLTRNLGFSRERIVAIAEAMYLNRTNDSLRQGLWLKAIRESAEEKPVGFIVTGDITAENPDRPPEGMTDEEMAKVPALMALLEEVRRPLDERYSFGRGQCLHIAALGVVPGCEGLGIGRRLLQAALARAEAIGYRYAVSECTGPGSRRCHEMCRFQRLHSVEYAGFEFRGTRPFAAIPGECHLMIREIS